MTTPRSYKRWYDAYHNTHALIQTAEKLPKSLQERLGQHFENVIREYQALLYDPFRLKSLGPHIITAMHKSHRKQRWYDQVPKLGKSITGLRTLPDPLLQAVNYRCKPLVEHLKSIEGHYYYDASMTEHYFKAYLTLGRDDMFALLEGKLQPQDLAPPAHSLGLPQPMVDLPFQSSFTDPVVNPPKDKLIPNLPSL